jgi:hypothetical protein
VIAGMADALLAQSAIDRLQSAAYELLPRRRVLPQAPNARPRFRRHDPENDQKETPALTACRTAVIIDLPTLQTREVVPSH